MTTSQLSPFAWASSFIPTSFARYKHTVCFTHRNTSERQYTVTHRYPLAISTTSDAPQPPKPDGVKINDVGVLSRLKNAETPLMDAIALERDRVRANFFCPGHKQGTTVHERLHDLLGEGPHSALSADLPELPALDNLFAPEGVIQSAQELAADAFTREGRKAWRSYFLVNGTTCGVEAALLACARPGSNVMLPRNAHQSAIHALVLCGATPVWIDPVYDTGKDIAHGVTVDSVRHALNGQGMIDTVMIVSPTYHGVISDVKAIADVVHEYGAKLIVDEAHGAHLAFFDGRESLPKSATECGADIVLHSVHKTLPALTQAAIMHVRRSDFDDDSDNRNRNRGIGIDEARIRASLQLVQSTSPSYLLLASLDAARALMQERGNTLLQRTVALAESCADRICALSGFSVLRKNDTHKSSQSAIIYAIDPTRITVLLPPQVTGYDIDEHLIDRFGVYAELPSFRHITFVLSVGTTQRDIDLLIASLAVYAVTTPVHDTPFGHGFHLEVPSSERRQAMVMTPRDAFFAPSVHLSAEEAIGRVSAETLCPYPPGIPVLLPGEVVTSHAVQMLRAVLKAGGSVSGASDNTLSTIRVIAEQNKCEG